VGTHDPALANAVRALRELILAGEKYRQVACGYLQLDIGQSQAVSYLYSRGPMGQSELGVLLGFTTGSMTALVDRLERDNIARRLPHPTDRRRTQLELTEHGRSAVNNLGRWLTGAFNHIDPSTLPEVTTTLTSIAGDLRRQIADLAAQPRHDNMPPPVHHDDRQGAVQRTPPG